MNVYDKAYELARAIKDSGEYKETNLNVSIRKLFDAERRLSVIMEDVQKIIAEPLQDIFK